MRNETISHAYVTFTSQLFGGRVTDYDNINYKHLGSPDVVNDDVRPGKVAEVKSSCHEERLPLRVNQIMNYEKVSESSDYEVHYVIWAYGNKRRKNSHSVITHDTDGLLVLSVDVLSPFVNPIREMPEFLHEIGLAKEFWKRLHFHPVEGLEIMGLDPSDYNIKPRRRVVGKRFRDKWKVKPFEMTTITNKNLRGLELIC
jgi:hypothetical protein